MVMLLLIAGMLLTVVVHEGAHVYMAKSLGWDFKGFGLNLKGFGVRISTAEPLIAASVWLVALAGPASNVVLADAFFLCFPGNPIATVLAYFNLALAASNALPLPGSDGLTMYRSLRGRIA